MAPSNLLDQNAGRLCQPNPGMLADAEGLADPRGDRVGRLQRNIHLAIPPHWLQLEQPSLGKVESHFWLFYLVSSTSSTATFIVSMIWEFVIFFITRAGPFKLIRSRALHSAFKDGVARGKSRNIRNSLYPFSMEVSKKLKTLLLWGHFEQILTWTWDLLNLVGSQ